jgi:subtilisin-like proprotein convertase family protein
MNLRRLLLCFISTLGFSLPAWAQTQNNPWAAIDESAIPQVGTRHLRPTQYRTLRLDLAQIEAILTAAPMEGSVVSYLSSAELHLPLPDGSFQRFRVVESPIMEPDLAAKFPEIQTYAAWGIDDPNLYARLDLTPQGFHAMITGTDRSTIFIDPYSFGGGDREHYLVYERQNYQSAIAKNFTCHTTGNAIPSSEETKSLAPRFGDCRLRTYRLALSATGEYTTFHGGTVALAQAAQVTTMNRVNGIFERELAVRMTIIANNNLLIYTNAATDPFTNGTPGTMINENQTNTTNVIGAANYDVGHVFGTNSGGLAGLGVVCANTAKARGVTGSAAPVGDPFDVDYVAHELGHQFGANHTFNNSCSSNRNNATAVEPGSGSTIMSYAGICAPNVQSQVHDNFHGISLQEMSTFITTGNGNTCPQFTTLTNGAPVITGTNVGTGKTIPANTPFMLTVNATDPNGTGSLRYSWEQMNNEISTQAPVGTSTGGPNFRCFAPSTNPTRYLPALPSAANTTWEVLPTVNRVLDFRVTVRDYATGGGCTDFEDVRVTVTNTGSAFSVTNPSNTGITWVAGTNQTVTWNVSGSDVAPVSCGYVNIFLSTDGGNTYPTLLASLVPNDGSQAVLVPNIATTTARIMVVCADNIFFDVSNNNFRINTVTSDFMLGITQANDTICPGQNQAFTVNVGRIGTFSTNTNLSVTGLPAGMTASFSTNPVVPNNNTTLTLSTTTAVAPGYYQLTLTGTAGGTSKIINFGVWILQPPPSASPTLVSPANAATGIGTSPTFTWRTVPGIGVRYDIQISTSPTFSTTTHSATNRTDTSYALPIALATSTTYYWRVRAMTDCGFGPYSSAFSFTTSNIACNTYASTNVPRSISATGTPTVTSTVNVPMTGSITDVNILNLAGTHTYIQDLTIRITSPAGTNVTLFNRICAGEDNFNINFDDAAASATLPCPPIGGGTFRPNQALSAFNTQNPNGTWTLTIVDNADQDGGSLNSWSLQVCAQLTGCSGLVPTATATNVSCNGGNNGTATASISGGTAPYTYAWTGGRTGASITGLTAGTYTVTITDNAACTATQTVTVTQPSALTLTATAVSATCNGGNNGSATASTTGGTSPYTYAWTGGRTGANITGLTAGTYTATVTDAGGCTATRSITVTQPSALTLSTTNTNVSCNGGNNGSATASTTGGTSPYTYAWTGGRTGANITGLTAGTYTATVTDAGGCTATRSLTITQPSALSANANVTATTCALNDGRASAAVSGGTAPYTYAWTGGRTGASITGLTVGTYTATITDANGCTTTTSAAVTNGCGCNLSVTTTNTNVSCNGASNGTATATPSNGTAPYTYAWTGGRTGASITGLSAGVYTVTVTDNAACVATRSLTITQPSALSLSTNSTSVTCNGGNNGSATANATGGTSPYTYAWTGGRTSASITGLTAGTYALTLTDANACTAFSSVTVIQATAITATATATNVSCFGGNNGTATATVTGGRSPYTYAWTGGRTGANITGLTAGTYTVTITDANACTTTRSVTLTQPAAINATATATNVSCNGGNNGTATATATGGASPYTFAWTGGRTGANITGLAAGTYTATITDANGCTTTRTATVTQPSVLALTATATNTGCATSTGTATATASGGTGPYTFAWTGGRTGANITGLAAGNYTVTVTDANACTLTRTVTVGQNAAPTLSLSSSPASCANNDGQISSSATGGTTPYTYLWSNGRTTATATGLSPGSYTLTLTDASGCVVTATTTVGFNCVCSVTASSTAVRCNNACDGSITISTTGMTNPISYLWSDGATTQNRSNLCAGNYQVTATSANGCSASLNFPVLLSNPSVLNLSLSSTNDNCNGNAGTATANASGGTGSGYTFVWTGGRTGATITGLAQGSYQVTATDANGCQNTGSINVGFTNNLSASITVIQNASCNGYTDGSAFVNAAGTGLSYQWSNGQNSATATGLAAGVYTVTVTATSGCSVTRSTTITQPNGLNVSITSSFQACNPNSGQMTVNISGGSFSSVLWSNGSSSTSIQGLSNGTYSVSVSYGSGCLATASQSLSIPAGPSTSIVRTNIACAGQNTGALDLSISPTANYTFSWSTGATTEDISGLAPGIYTVQINDPVNNCVIQLRDTITAAPAFSLVVSGTDATSPSAQNGSAAVTANGGTAPYTYQWSNGGSTASILGLSPGTYAVTVTDANACSQTASVIVGPPVSVEELNAFSTRFQILPNPNYGSFEVLIELPQPSEFNLRLMDVLGRVLHEEQLQGQQFRLPYQQLQLAPGTYFIQLSNAQGQQTKKFVVKQ